METKEYKTKTMFKEIANPVLSPDKWCIGLDIGYSAVKGISQNSLVCFPAFAIENTGSTQISFGYTSEDNQAIHYRDEDGVEWSVGASAQDTISASDTSAGSLSAYGRHRYFAPMFKVLFRTGLASLMRANQYGDPAGKKIVLQTGLPPKYLKNDERDFREVLIGHHHFFVKYGMQPWQEFDFELTEDNILPMISQPMGTILSISTSKDIKPVADAAKYFNSKILIMDAGFGTLDLFPMLKGEVTVSTCETDSNLGMKRVLQDTAEEIQEKYGFEVSVPAMQQYLETGMVPARFGRTFKNTAFNDILEKHSRDICYQAIDKLMNTYNITDYQYIIITGGTCAAWSNFIREHEFFKGNDVVKIVSGNQGDPTLPYIFSNVRGYFVYATVNARS